MDIVISAVFIAFAALPMVGIALAVHLSSPGPVFFRQRRMGRDGVPFTVLKFRTMFMESDSMGPRWASVRDPRVTRVGRILRMWHADELPQLFQVIAGSMSLVGPRPEQVDLHADFCSRIPGFARRLEVRPGLTGWAQVNGGYDLDAERKLQYDIDYVEHWSVVFDVLILARTVRTVLAREGVR